ncbi:MAG TPA: DUF2283 domain-containing protein [Candidatus Binatia bacterium]|nr:DUF2283 domain-containing protein [Candidatus Binatia bacterium]
MEITYDRAADALYIRLKKGKFAKNATLDLQTIFDLDAKGNLLGIELLNASKRVARNPLKDVRLKDITHRGIEM